MISPIEDGASICLAPDYSGCSLALIRELIKKGCRGLHLIGCPQLGLQADLLIAAGCVASIETAAIGLGEAGQAPAFARAYRQGEIDVFESTCPAIHSALQAAEKGVPFLPVASVIGSDLIAARPDWRIVNDPYSGRDILTVPAIKPDFAMLHAPLADRDGAVWIGVRRELMLMCHAAACALATVERIVDHSLVRDVDKAAGTIPGIYVQSVATVPQGARPSGLFGDYGPDRGWIECYLDAAKDTAELAKFIDRWAREEVVA